MTDLNQIFQTSSDLNIFLIVFLKGWFQKINPFLEFKLITDSARGNKVHVFHISQFSFFFAFQVASYCKFSQISSSTTVLLSNKLLFKQIWNFEQCVGEWRCSNNMRKHYNWIK